MVTRQTIKRSIIRKQLGENPCVDNELTIPGDPMIYSIKYSLETRMNHANYFRNNQYASMIKCICPNVNNPEKGVVVFVKFFVSPPSYVKVSEAALKAERTPAVQSHECLDYALSFLEMLSNVVFSSYRQIVKIDIEKWYSLKPRTTFRFIKWGDYVEYQANNSIYPSRKSQCKVTKERMLQSDRERHEKNRQLRQKLPENGRAAIAKRCAARARALQDTAIEESQADGQA